MSPSATPATQKTAASQPTTGDQTHSKSQPSAVSATHSFTPNAQLCHRQLSHAQLCHAQLCHTQLCNRQLFHIQHCHTQLSHTQLCHTQLCNRQFFWFFDTNPNILWPFVVLRLMLGQTSMQLDSMPVQEHDSQTCALWHWPVRRGDFVFASKLKLRRPESGTAVHDTWLFLDLGSSRVFFLKYLFYGKCS